MSKHDTFKFKSADELKAKAAELGVNLPFSDDLSCLSTPVKVGNKMAPNAIAVLPMEGCDSHADGSPSALVTRRYLRAARGGAGLIWIEATAVVEEGRANANQLMITEENLESFRDLAAMIKADAAVKSPLLIVQLTHSGRYSRPVGHDARPLIAQRDPILDPRVNADASSVVTDEYLDSLVAHYVKSAQLVEKAGFDGVDIKACHRYLLSELLASHTREGKYGGSFENRTRLLLDIIKAVKAATGPDFIVASRFNVFDAHPYPYGFGQSKENPDQFDPEEPLKLVRLMVEAGVQLLSNSAGNPYYLFPQVTRPFDQSSEGIPIPDEHPLESCERLFGFSRMIQEAAGDVPVIGNGYSWLRQYLFNVGAANLQDGSCQMIGLGRESFAYPDAPLDILTKGALDAKKCCTACSKCTQIMRDHGMTGCVVRDAGVYVRHYREAQADAAARRGAV